MTPADVTIARSLTDSLTDEETTMLNPFIPVPDPETEQDAVIVTVPARPRESFGEAAATLAVLLIFAGMLCALLFLVAPAPSDAPTNTPKGGIAHVR